MEMDKRILVIAGNRSQFNNWLRKMVIPMTGKEDIRNLYGIRFHDVYYEGTWQEWFDREIESELRVRVIEAKQKPFTIPIIIGKGKRSLDL